MQNILMTIINLFFPSAITVVIYHQHYHLDYRSAVGTILEYFTATCIVLVMTKLLVIPFSLFLQEEIGMDFLMYTLIAIIAAAACGLLRIFFQEYLHIEAKENERDAHEG